MAKRITTCQPCRKRVYKARNDAWYHHRTNALTCNWPNGRSDRKAVPLEIEVAR